MKNPLTKAAVMQVDTTLPALLRERGWALAFTNRGGSCFTLEPGESREIVMSLAKGRDFSADDVRGVEDRIIRVAARADDRIDGLAEALMRSLGGRRQRVREVEVRKVTLEIEMEDCDDE